jgi:hypothetical protein
VRSRLELSHRPRIREMQVCDPLDLAEAKIIGTDRRDLVRGVWQSGRVGSFG